MKVEHKYIGEGGGVDSAIATAIAQPSLGSSCRSPVKRLGSGWVGLRVVLQVVLRVGVGVGVGLRVAGWVAGCAL